MPGNPASVSESISSDASESDWDIIHYYKAIMYPENIR